MSRAATKNNNIDRMVLRFFVLALLTLLALAARAGEGVLVESVPANIDKAAALTAAREALQYRDWTIVGQDADSISATISRQNIDARIRIKVSGTRLLYDESARGGKPKMDFTGRMVPAVTGTPERWINFLRSDITAGLMTRAASGTGATAQASAAKEAPTAARGNAVQRMQELKEMLDKGLISADEYARKKDEILKNL